MKHVETPSKPKAKGHSPVAMVSSNYAYSYFQTCIDLGADESALLDILDTSRNELNNPLVRYSCDSLLSMIHAAEGETRNRTIGLISGRNFRPSTFANVGLALISANSLRHALAVNATYQRLTQEFGTTRLDVNNGVAQVQWTPRIADAERLRHVTEAVYAGYVSIGRWLLWHYDEDALLVRFRHANPEGHDACAEYFGCEVLYNQPVDSLDFKGDLADKPLPQANPELLKLLEERLSQALRFLDGRQSISNQVHQLLQYELAQGCTTLEKTANVLGLSTRQLSHQLKKDDVSFSEIIKTVRIESADFYVREGKKSLSEIALLLGYSEQSAFTRAYRSWHGVPPSVRNTG